MACHDEVSRELKLLVDQCEVLVAQRTATINRLRWRVHELDPERAPKAASLDLAKHRRLLGQWLNTQPVLVAELAREELADITRLTEAINALAKRIGERVRAVAPALLAMPGCGELTAAKLVGEAPGVTRFKSEAAFARHAGVVPIPVWSGNTLGRVRMTRSGNRQLNAALHRIAVTQIRLDGPGRAYYRKRLDAGASRPEAYAVSNAAWPASSTTTCTPTTKTETSLANRLRLDVMKGRASAPHDGPGGCWECSLSTNHGRPLWTSMTAGSLSASICIGSGR